MEHQSDPTHDSLPGAYRCLERAHALRDMADRLRTRVAAQSLVRLAEQFERLAIEMANSAE
jgi:hypothetical protein